MAEKNFNFIYRYFVQGLFVGIIFSRFGDIERNFLPEPAEHEFLDGEV